MHNLNLMISLSQRAKSIFAKKNTVYIAAGVIAAGLGVYLLAGDKIKNIFSKKEDFDIDVLPVVDPVIISGNIQAPAKKPEKAGIDINKKLRKGVKGPEVTRLQFIINFIAGYRKQTSYKTPAGFTVKFPIASDGDFGNGTQAGAFYIAPSFKNDGFITLDTARARLAYIAGYYRAPFPSELVETSNVNKYQESFKAGRIDFGKQDRAKNIGAFVNPFNP